MRLPIEVDTRIAVPPFDDTDTTIYGHVAKILDIYELKDPERFFPNPDPQKGYDTIILGHRSGKYKPNTKPMFYVRDDTYRLAENFGLKFPGDLAGKPVVAVYKEFTVPSATDESGFRQEVRCISLIPLNFDRSEWNLIYATPEDASYDEPDNSDM